MKEIEPAFPSNKQIFSKKQREWINGFLFGLSDIFQSKANNDNKKNETIHILYGTQTGNAEDLAYQFQALCQTNSIKVEVKDMGKLQVKDFQIMKTIFIIISTYGEGDMPDSVENLWKNIKKQKSLDLTKLSYSVLALGDSSYTYFCQAGKNWDEKLKVAQARRIVKRVDCDVDFEKKASQWMQDCLTQITEKKSITSSPTLTKKEPIKYSLKNPYLTYLKKKKLLSGKNSTKEVWHYEVALKEKSLSYEAGDCLAIIPVNSNELVTNFLNLLKFNRKEKINGKSLFLTLKENYEIRQPNKKTLEKLAETDKNLANAIAQGNLALKEYLWGREHINLIKENPSFSPSIKEFLNLLSPIKARIYSISSSLKKHPKEVHLTIASVRYNTFSTQHFGVCSTYLADSINEKQELQVFLVKNKSFKIPLQKDAKIIMVGPGTGIAPFRAFLEEREIKGHTGKNWLFFGDRNKNSDFLYKEEINSWVKNKFLTYLNLAFSRDQKEKVYVQHKMLERGKELFQWLEEGAYFFVCGDAYSMAKSVDKSLHKIIEKHGNYTKEKAIEYVQNLKIEKRYLRDVY